MTKNIAMTSHRKWHQVLFEFSLNRTTRMWKALEPHVNELQKQGPKHIQKELKGHIEKFEKIQARVRVLRACNAMAFLLLYVSVVSTFVGGFFIIEEVLSIAQFVSGIAGSTALIVLIAIFSKLINLYVSDAHIIADFIVALKVKYLPESSKEIETFV